MRNAIPMIDWIIKWLTGKLTGKMQQGIDHRCWSNTHGRAAFRSQAGHFGESLSQMQFILDPFPSTANDHWLSIPACSGALDCWGKHSTIHFYTSVLPPRSFLPRSCTCQLHQTRMWISGSVREAAPPPTSAMDECFSYLFIAFCCSLLLLYPFLYPPPSQINFCHSERRADKGKSITVI